MSAPRREEVHLRAVLVVVLYSLVAVALQVAGALNPGYPLWGVQHYGFVPAGWLAVGGGGALLLFALLWGGREGGTGGSVARGITTAAVLLAGAALFYFGREQLHFLGEGEARIEGVLQGRFLWSIEPLGTFVPFVLHRLLPVDDPTIAFVLLSVASGLVYLGFALRFAWDIGGGSRGFVAVFGLLALAGVSRLFFGYVETYPLLAASVIAYLVLAVRLLRGQGSPWVTAVAGVIPIFVHSIALVLLPSLVFVLLANPQRGEVKKALPLLLVPVVALIGYEALLRNGGSSLAALLGGYAGAVLPGSGGRTIQAPYALFSLAHLRDVFQGELLVGPFAGIFALLLVGVRAGGKLAPEERFLLAAGIPWWIATFLLNPPLGAPRQWGLHAPGAIPFLMLIGLLLVRLPWRIERPRLAGALTGIVLGATFFHTLPWVVLGTDRDRSLGQVAALYGPGSPAARRARGATFDALGTWYLSRGEADNAEMAYKEAVTADTTATYAAGHLASVFLASGRAREAAGLLAWAAGRTPEREFLHYELGNAYRTLGSPDSAAAAYRRAVARNPDFLQAYVRLSGVCLDLGRVAEAESALVEARRRFPDDPAVRANLGRVAQEKGDTLTAMTLYREALARNPDDADTAFNVGLLLMNAGRWSEAAGYFGLVVDRRPRDAEGWVNLGVCRERQLDAPGALVAFRQATALAPRRPEGVFNLVRIQVAIGDTASALATLRGYAAGDSTSRFGILARDLLRALGGPAGR